MDNVQYDIICSCVKIPQLLEPRIIYQVPVWKALELTTMYAAAMQVGTVRVSAVASDQRKGRSAAFMFRYSRFKNGGGFRCQLPHMHDPCHPLLTLPLCLLWLSQKS